MNITEKINKKELEELLIQFDINSFGECEMIDSSHGESDIRHNYIIDKKYVLRINSAKVMTEERIKELNILIKRYNDFGLKAPYYISNVYGAYVLEYNDFYCYLSEYLDYPLAEGVEEPYKKELFAERIQYICEFAEQFKDIDLIETLSMYSLFDLAPYDQPKGIDEKQENFDALMLDLKASGEFELADRLTAAYATDRNELRAIYKNLPRCVFQGDENFSNLCVDEESHIIGLFDFNMSGTEVIANYLANIAFQGDFDFSEELLEVNSPKEVLELMMNAYYESTKTIQEYYDFSDMEWRAYELYSRIVLISGYINTWAYSEFLKSEKHKEKIVELLWLIENNIKFQ